MLRAEEVVFNLRMIAKIWSTSKKKTTGRTYRFVISEERFFSPAKFGLLLLLLLQLRQQNQPPECKIISREECWAIVCIKWRGTAAGTRSASCKLLTCQETTTAKRTVAALLLLILLLLNVVFGRPIQQHFSLLVSRFDSGFFRSTVADFEETLPETVPECPKPNEAGCCNTRLNFLDYLFTFSSAHRNQICHWQTHWYKIYF